MDISRLANKRSGALRGSSQFNKAVESETEQNVDQIITDSVKKLAADYDDFEKPPAAAEGNNSLEDSSDNDYEDQDDVDGDYGEENYEDGDTEDDADLADTFNDNIDVLGGNNQEEDLTNASTKEPEKEDTPKNMFKDMPEDKFELGKDALNAGYSVSIETMAIAVMNENVITNLSLKAFGESAKMYEPQVLSLITFGNHKFIGRPLSHIDKFRLFYMIRTEFEKDNKPSFNLKLTQTVQYKGLTYTSLVATEEDLKLYSSMFGQDILCYKEEPDEDNLVAIIKR